MGYGLRVTGYGLRVMGYGLWVTGKCTNGCTMLLQSSDYPPTMVRLNSAQRNEYINRHAAWLNREKAYGEADRSSNARKEKAKEKKEPKKRKRKRKALRLKRL